jgi:hypothetical protein
MLLLVKGTPHAYTILAKHLKAAIGTSSLCCQCVLQHTVKPPDISKKLESLGVPQTELLLYALTYYTTEGFG